VQSYAFEKEHDHLFISPRDNTCKAVLIFKGLSDKCDSVSPKLVLDYLCRLMINIFTSKSGYKANNLKEKACYRSFAPLNNEENSLQSNNLEIHCSATLFPVLELRKDYLMNIF